MMYPVLILKLLSSLNMHEVVASNTELGDLCLLDMYPSHRNLVSWNLQCLCKFGNLFPIIPHTRSTGERCGD